MARFGTKRPTGTQELRPLFVLVFDDAKTAPAYFDALRETVKGKCTIKPVRAPKSGGTSEKFVQCAIAQKDAMHDQDSPPKVWAIVDLEMATDSTSQTDILRKGASAGAVEVALSQPCFEVWTLAHFVSTGRAFTNCDAALAELKKQWKAAFYQPFPKQKANADYRKLMDKATNAVDNAKKHNASNSQSWTEVWQVVEAILNA